MRYLSKNDIKKSSSSFSVSDIDICYVDPYDNIAIIETNVCKHQVFVIFKKFSSNVIMQKTSNINECDDKTINAITLKKILPTLFRKTTIAYDDAGNMYVNPHVIFCCEILNMYNMKKYYDDKIIKEKKSLSVIDRVNVIIDKMVNDDVKVLIKSHDYIDANVSDSFVDDWYNDNNNDNHNDILTRIKSDPTLLIFIDDENVCVEAVRENPYALEYVINQTEKICIEAVQKSGDVLRFVRNQSNDICCKAVQQYPYALKYVINQNENMCIEAVKKSGHVLNYVNDQTYNICIEAVRNDGEALQYVNNQSHDICIEAVKNKGNALQYVKDQDETICIHAVQNNYKALQYVKNKTFDIAFYAVKISWKALEYIEDQNENVCIEALINYENCDINKELYTLIKLHPCLKDMRAIKKIKHDCVFLSKCKIQNNDICERVVIKNGLELEYVIYQTENICKLALGENGMALNYVKQKTYDLCLIAVKQNSDALKYVSINDVTNDEYNELCMIAIKNNNNTLKYVEKQNETICELFNDDAILFNGIGFIYLDEEYQTYDICKKMVEHRYVNVLYIKNKDTMHDMIKKLKLELFA
jgi:hypothetical protein